MNLELIWNAFANGVVPKGVDENWLFGREKEYSALKHMLDLVKNQGICGFRLLEGDYGSGKTMVLSVLEAEALKQGFIVSRISLGLHNNFSKPEIFYKDIMSHLRVGDATKETAFEDIFEKWLKETKQESQANMASKKINAVIQELQEYHPSFANVLLAYIRGKINGDLELSKAAAAWIKGDYNLPYELKKRLNIKGNIDRYNALDILKGLSKLLVLLGFTGLVICVDELEWIMSERSDIRNKAYMTMRQFIDEIGENSWTKTLFIGAHTSNMMMDMDKGYRSYEALYQRISSGFNDRGYLKDYKSMTVISLKPLSKDALIDFGMIVAMMKRTVLKEHKIEIRHICELAYIECSKRANIEKKDITVREYLKMLVHLLELAINNPNMIIFKVNQK